MGGAILPLLNFVGVELRGLHPFASNFAFPEHVQEMDRILHADMIAEALRDGHKLSGGTRNDGSAGSQTFRGSGMGKSRMCTPHALGERLADHRPSRAGQFRMTLTAFGLLIRLFIINRPSGCGLYSAYNPMPVLSTNAASVAHNARPGM